MAIRDAVNRSTRKPFAWGGLAGYQQLEAIDQALTQLVNMGPESAYFQQLSKQVKRVLDKNRTLANNVKEAHQWLQQISDCLRYPRRSHSDVPSNSHQVAREMQELLDSFIPDPKYQRPQTAIKNKLQRTWDLYGPDLLHTYDIPGLPPDNLQIESLFGRLRRHQRRVSGRKSTRPLREFGHTCTCATSAGVFRFFSPPIVKLIYSTISAPFRCMNIVSIGNNLNLLRPLGVLCTVSIRMQKPLYSV